MINQEGYRKPSARKEAEGCSRACILYVCALGGNRTPDAFLRTEALWSTELRGHLKEQRGLKPRCTAICAPEGTRTPGLQVRNLSL